MSIKQQNNNETDNNLEFDFSVRLNLIFLYNLIGNK